MRYIWLYLRLLGLRIRIRLSKGGIQLSIVQSKMARNVAGKEDGVGKDGTTNGNFFMFGSRNVEGAD